MHVLDAPIPVMSVCPWQGPQAAASPATPGCRARGGWDGCAPLRGLDDQPGRVAQLEAGGVEWALLLVGIEQAFGRGQLEDVDVVKRQPCEAALARSSSIV